LGIKCTIISPKKLFPDESLVTICKNLGEKSGSKILISDSLSLVKGADCIYTDVWISMGEESLREERLSLLKPYQVNSKLMEMTENPNCIFLHCLPAVKDEEVTTEVIEGSQSKVWDQAENRKHTIKAIMLATI